jgi:hypothetical protein
MSDLTTSATSGRTHFLVVVVARLVEHGGSMMIRVAAAALFVVATAGSARAQAPGDVQLAPPGEVQPAPMAPPPLYVVQPPPRESVMANRWAVGLSIGHLSLSPQGSTDPSAKTDFGVGELSLRFRATLHLELELALGGGQQQNPDGTPGDLEAHTGMLAARYRFCAECPWNWWLMAGLGAASIVQHGATDQEVSDAQRPLAAVGIGIERRFRHFALNAELSAISLGAPKNADTIQPVLPPPAPSSSTSTQVPTMPPPPSPSGMTDKLSGGQLTIGASFYF